MDWQAFESAFTGQQITAETVISAVIVVAIGVLLSWFLGRRLRRAVGRPGDTNQQMEKLVGRIVQWGVIGISIAWALSILGLDIGWFAVFLALALVISSFALKPLVQSFATSVLIASRPAFSVGDDISVDDVTGEVIEITERSVVIRQRDGARVHVPNVKVLAMKVTVYSTETARRSVIELKLAIDTDIEHVEHVARTSLGDLEEVSRFGWVHAVSLDGVVGVSIAFWHHSGLEAQPRAVDAAIRALQRSFADAGIHPVSAVDVQIVDSELTLRRGD